MRQATTTNDRFAAARPRTAPVVACLALLAACGSTGGSARRPAVPPGALELSPGDSGVAIHCAKALTLDAADAIHAPATILVKNGKLAWIGPRREAPAGYEVRAADGLWASPGMVELHSHIHSGGFGDTNDMVLPINGELRAMTALRPGNPLVRRAVAGGVTTLYGIPGSGTSMSGFGVIYKTKLEGGFEDVVLHAVGGLKVAQSYNPERGAGDLGRTRAGLAWILEDAADRAKALRAADAEDLANEDLAKVMERELPVLIHCAGSDGFAAAARMWQVKYGTRCVLSHGCFDAHATAPWIVAVGAPINAGPRVVDYMTTRDGAITGTAAKYLEAGAKDLSLNTDSPVLPQEELFLQGAMSARYGADDYQMLRGCTIAPARVFGLDHRLGSLEAGKDADIVLSTGSPLDPRSRVERVYIDGTLQYDRARDGQWF